MEKKKEAASHGAPRHRLAGEAVPLSPDSNVIQTCAAEARGRGDGDVEPGAQAAARRGARNSVGAGDL